MADNQNNKMDEKKIAVNEPKKGEQAKDPKATEKSAEHITKKAV